MDIVYHYPPELLNLLIDVIPLLSRSKKDVLQFFRGAGVEALLMQDIERTVVTNRGSITKYEIARRVLSRVNEKGEPTLRERREILKRVTEYEDFSTCWANDQLKAKGLVAEVRRVINVKDSFTRMNLEREAERKERQKELRARQEKEKKRKQELSEIHKELGALFAERNPQKRGKALEGVLKRLFAVSTILVREAFTLRGDQGEGVIEQIDGVVEIGGALYLVELKWLKDRVGRPDVSEHLVRVFSRSCARGIFISVSGYTEPAVTTCKEALQKAVVVLCTLEEIVKILEQEQDIRECLKAKINAAIIDKNPFHKM